ncbi:hypothetical protein CHS0354_036770 [Potamilus streckersoni]|uniref:UDENN FLCN/SMCR8-type domain-containing protein n=1 Tax=Potamilus streckersoni TaxID=2493646 RepID=A0AAE0VPA7_9BIVA|nr:hypothetical protein CHS0354_036770 [Potamilus streckersoni]
MMFGAGVAEMSAISGDRRMRFDPLDHLFPKYRQSNPWLSHDGSSLEDFILIAEFSEREGPKPVLVIPKDGGQGFDQNEFSVRILAVDHHSSVTDGFHLTEDNQVVMEDSENEIYTFVHHLVLNDFLARGYVRPFCISYITKDSRKIMSCYTDLSQQMNKVARYIKYGNRLVFMRDLEQHLEDLRLTKETLLKVHGHEADGHDTGSELSPSDSNLLASLNLIRQAKEEVDAILCVMRSIMEDRQLAEKFAHLERQFWSQQSQETIDNYECFTLEDLSCKDIENKDVLGSTYASFSDSLYSLRDNVYGHNGYKPKLLDIKTLGGRSMFDCSLRGLHELCSWGAREGLRRLRAVREYFKRDSATLAFEDLDQQVMSPNEGLLSFGPDIIGANFLHRDDRKTFCDHQSFLASDSLMHWKSYTSLDSFKSVSSSYKSALEEGSSLMSAKSSLEGGHFFIRQSSDTSGSGFCVIEKQDITRPSAPLVSDGDGIGTKGSCDLPTTIESPGNTASCDNQTTRGSCDNPVTGERCDNPFFRGSCDSYSTHQSYIDFATRDSCDGTSSSSNSDTGAWKGNNENAVTSNHVYNRLGSSSLATMTISSGLATRGSCDSPPLGANCDSPTTKGSCDSLTTKGSSNCSTTTGSPVRCEEQLSDFSLDAANIVNADSLDIAPVSMDSCETFTAYQTKEYSSDSKIDSTDSSLPKHKEKRPYLWTGDNGGYDCINMPFEDSNDTGRLERKSLEHEVVPLSGIVHSEYNFAKNDSELLSVQGENKCYTDADNFTKGKCTYRQAIIKHRKKMKIYKDIFISDSAEKCEYGLLKILSMYSNLHYPVYSLLTGRPVVVIGTKKSEKQIKDITDALRVFVPYRSGCDQVTLFCQIKQFKLCDISRFSLVGVIRGEKKSLDYIVPQFIRRYITLFDVDRLLIESLPYQGDFLSFLPAIFSKKSSFKSEEAVLTFIQMKLINISSRAFQFFHCFFHQEQKHWSGGNYLRRNEKVRDACTAYLNKQNVFHSDVLIVKFLSKVIHMQLLEQDLRNKEHQGKPSFPLMVPYQSNQVFKVIIQKEPLP